jgi:hypothetical protein
MNRYAVGTVVSLFSALAIGDARGQAERPQRLDLPEKAIVYYVGVYQPKCDDVGRYNLIKIFPLYADMRKARSSDKKELAEFWKLLPEKVQQGLSDDVFAGPMVSEPRPVLRSVESGLYDFLSEETLAKSELAKKLDLPAAAKKLLALDKRTRLQTRRLNHYIVDRLFPGHLKMREEEGYEVNVSVEKQDRPVALILTGYHSCRWVVTRAEDAPPIELVLISGYEHQEVEAEAKQQIVSSLWFPDKRLGAEKYFQGRDPKSKEYRRAREIIQQMIGRDPDHHIGQYEWDGKIIKLTP